MRHFLTLFAFALAGTVHLQAGESTQSRDAGTIQRSNRRVTLRITLPDATSLTVTELDGKMSRIKRGDGSTYGITPAIRPDGSVGVTTFTITKGPNGEDALRFLEKTDTVIGSSVHMRDDLLIEPLAIDDTASPSVTCSEATSPLGAKPVPLGGGKCCVTCGETTACSYCRVEHDCGSCCAGECCP